MNDNSPKHAPNTKIGPVWKGDGTAEVHPLTFRLLYAAAATIIGTTPPSLPLPSSGHVPTACTQRYVKKSAVSMELTIQLSAENPESRSTETAQPATVAKMDADLSWAGACATRNVTMATAAMQPQASWRTGPSIPPISSSSLPYRTAVQNMPNVNKIADRAARMCTVTPAATCP